MSGQVEFHDFKASPLLKWFIYFTLIILLLSDVETVVGRVFMVSFKIADRKFVRTLVSNIYMSASTSQLRN